MRERNFIAQNKDKWKELEVLLKEKRKDPDKLTRLFIQVTDDLAYARTFYPTRYVCLYLNGIAQQLFYLLYNNKKTSKNKFLFFWKEELPRLIYDARKALLFSLAFFILSICIGVLSSAYEPEFASVILGKDYVEMTLENIRKGDPMAVYKSVNQVDMFLGITFNNLWVSFLTFLSGIVYCIGSIGLLLYNGVMIGVFQYFFFKQHLMMTSMLTIWLHGTLEISSIIIAAGAGVTMGRGLIFPGTHSRFQSFFLSARRGIKILLGILPIIVIAAIIESFVTRYTGAPVLLKAGLILISLSFIIVYFVWLPYKKHKEISVWEPDEKGLHSNEESVHDFSIIHSNGMIFREILNQYKKGFGKILSLSLLLSALASFTIYNTLSDSDNIINGNRIFFSTVFNYDNHYKYFFINVSLFSIIIFLTMRSLARKVNPHFTTGIVSFLKVIFFSLIINSFFFMNGFLAIVFTGILAPLLLLWLSISFYEKRDLLVSFVHSLSLLDAALGKAIGFFLIVILTSVLFFILIDSPLLSIYVQILKWNFNLSWETLQTLNSVLGLFIPYFALLFILPMIFLGNFLEYFTLREIHGSIGLRKRIQSLKIPKV